MSSILIEGNVLFAFLIHVFEPVGILVVCLRFGLALGRIDETKTCSRVS
jgi:hypothetical protein